MATDGASRGTGRTPSLWKALLAGILAVAVPAIEPEFQPQKPDPSAGSVTPAGKFVPAVSAAPLEASTTELIVADGPGRLRIAGCIVLDQAARTVSIPAVVNMRHGQVEYLLVSERGKCHESVFRTAAQPEHLHLACLLAGMPSASVPMLVAGRTPVVTVEMLWHRHGPPARVALAELVYPAPEAPPPPPGQAAASWLYNGSLFTAAGFAAQLEGSCIALIPDPSALINASGLPPGPYLPVADRLPAEGTPVSLVLHLPLHVSTAEAKP